MHTFKIPYCFLVSVSTIQWQEKNKSEKSHCSEVWEKWMHFLPEIMRCIQVWGHMKYAKIFSWKPFFISCKEWKPKGLLQYTPENIIRINPKFANIERFQLHSMVDKTWKGITKVGVFFSKHFYSKHFQPWIKMEAHRNPAKILLIKFNFLVEEGIWN